MIELKIVSAKTNEQICEIRLRLDSNIREVKKHICYEHSNFKIERLALRLQPTEKNQSDEITLTTLGFHKGGTLYLKDLGPQIRWKTVFLLEYFGAFVVYVGVALIHLYNRSYSNLYKDLHTHKRYYGKQDLNQFKFQPIQWVLLVCWCVHYLKRLYETQYVHVFSHGFMPIRNVYKNCAYYWGFAFIISYCINHHFYTPAAKQTVAFGITLFIFCELGNYAVHKLLSDLRPDGCRSTKKPEPNSNPFSWLYRYVACPNYTYEFGAWMGFALASWCLPALVFACCGLGQMTIWAVRKHKAYKRDFEDYYTPYAIIPLVV